MVNSIGAFFIGAAVGFVVGAVIFTQPGREVAAAAARRVEYYVEPPRKRRR